MKTISKPLINKFAWFVVHFRSRYSVIVWEWMIWDCNLSKQHACFSCTEEILNSNTSKQEAFPVQRHWTSFNFI